MRSCSASMRLNYGLCAVGLVADRRVLGFGIGILLGVQVLYSRLLGIGQEAGSGRIFRRGALVGHRDGQRVDGRARAICHPFFHFVFVTIAPASPEAAAAA